MKSNTNDSPGLLLFGPGVSTGRFFRTLNRIEAELNRRNEDVVS